MFKKLLQDEEGASMTEYILLVVLIAIAAYTVIRLFGKQIQSLFTKSTGKLTEAEAEIP